MDNVFISVVLPAYKGKFLGESIKSILDQSYKNFELIIVDDCSPENLKAIVDDFSDHRIIYYRNETNIGGQNLIHQWNKSINYAKGEYIVLAADDDTYEINFLERCVKLALKFPSCDLIRGRVNCIDEFGNSLSHERKINEFVSKYEYLYHWLEANIYICIGNFMFKASVLKDKKFIEFPSAFCSDIATTIEIAENGVGNTEELLFNFRISSIHLSSSINLKQIEDKLIANNEFYKWIFNLNYQEPNNESDRFFFKKIQYSHLYQKCVFDFYNQAYKFLPLNKLWYINKLTVLKLKDKLRMCLRYFYNRIR